MNGEEIKRRIIENNDMIQHLLDPSTFILNKEVVKLREYNKYLRNICPHEFNELGYCIYCDKQKI